jgi:hypothetical protein
MDAGSGFSVPEKGAAPFPRFGRHQKPLGSLSRTMLQGQAVANRSERPDPRGRTTGAHRSCRFPMIPMIGGANA